MPAEIARGGVLVGMVEDGLDGFRCGGDPPRGGGDGSWGDSEVKGEAQGREGLDGVEDTLFLVYDETGFSEGVYEPGHHSRMPVDGVYVGEGGTEAIIDVDDHSPGSITAPLSGAGRVSAVCRRRSWIKRFLDRLHSQKTK